MPPLRSNALGVLPHAQLDQVRRTCEGARERTLVRQIEIAAVAAPTGHETERASLVSALLRQAGFAGVTQDAVGNVCVTVHPSGHPSVHPSQDTGIDMDIDTAPVVVMAHLDTVFTDLTLPAARHDGARVYASGISDNGRGLSAMVSLAELLQHQYRNLLRRPVAFVATVGEEGVGNLRGARHYLDARHAEGAPVPSAVVALDGPGDSLIVHHAIASRRLRFSFATVGGHPWVDVHAPNAAHAAARAMAAISRMADVQPSGITVTITRMGGGESLTSIPAHAWFDVDLRTLDQRHMARVSAAVYRIAEHARAESCRGSATGVSLEAQVLGDRPGGALDERHPLVRLAIDATTWIGVEPQSASASSDANIPLSRGIPAISIGAGGLGGGAHSASEWYEDREGPRGVARAMAVILGAASALA